MSWHYSRRDFLKHVGSSSAAFSVYALTGGCEELLRDIRDRPVRRDIGNLSPNDPIVQTYRDAVQQMRNLPSSDPRNWTEQARIHLDHCPHGNWYFLPWHRAYLFYFEQICRELTGEPEFALPYWNWGQDAQIPAAFWGPGNPLNHGRSATSSSTANPSIVGPARLANIMNLTNFFTFASGQSSAPRPTSPPFGSYGELEGGPHNYIHGFVGGDMSSFMSPLDPIFWTHHNMIDCMWASWNIDRGNPNTNDTQWTQFDFTDFVDGQGNPVNIRPITTVLMPLVSYRFEPCMTGGAGGFRVTGDMERVRQTLREGANVQLDVLERFRLRRGIDLRVGEPVSVPVEVERQAINAALRDDQTHLLLTVGGVAPPRSEDFFVRVFLNQPGATQETPFEDPHFAGSFAFFNDAQVQNLDQMRMNYVVDVTDTLRRLRERDAVGAEGGVSVQFIAVPIAGREPEARETSIESIELAVARPPKTTRDEP